MMRQRTGKSNRCEDIQNQTGEFKTYFAHNTNCVKLADYITGSAGLDVLDVSGIVTPGSYYAAFGCMFERRNTIVVSKTIYRN